MCGHHTDGVAWNRVGRQVHEKCSIGNRTGAEHLVVVGKRHFCIFHRGGKCDVGSAFEDGVVIVEVQRLWHSCAYHQGGVAEDNPGAGHLDGIRVGRAGIGVEHVQETVEDNTAESLSLRCVVGSRQQKNHAVLTAHGLVPRLVNGGHQRSHRPGGLTILGGTHPGFRETVFTAIVAVLTSHRDDEGQFVVVG